MEAMIDTWISYVAKRPAVARVALRETASVTPTHTSAIAKHAERLFELATTVINEGVEQGLFRHVNPIRILSAVAGPTVFFVAVMPALGFSSPTAPLEKEELDAHRAEVLGIARRILGTRGPRPAKRGR